MLREEEATSAYEKATDGCRPLALGSRDNAQKSQRSSQTRRPIPLWTWTAKRCRRGISTRRRLLLCEQIHASDGDHTFRLQLLATAPSSPSVHDRSQSDSNSSRNSVMMLRHLRIAQRMMPRCWIVNSPSMIALFTMSSILSSADDPAVAS